jgi:Restriction endonuclease
MSHRLPSEIASLFFSKLKPTQFEELCYDLIDRLGFERLVWRKGSGGDSSPSDGSRDIEALWISEEPDGGRFEQLWLIDAKHSTNPRGLNKEKVSDFLSIRGIRSDVSRLLIMTSGYITNSLRDEIERINNQKDIVRVWERHKLIAFIVRYPELLLKYGLEWHLDYLTQFHPNHVTYMRDVAYVTREMIEGVFGIADTINKDAVNYMKFEICGGTNNGVNNLDDLLKKFDEVEKLIGIGAGKVFMDSLLRSALMFSDSTRIEWQRMAFKKILAENADKDLGNTEEMLLSLDTRNSLARRAYISTCEILLPIIFELQNADLQKMKRAVGNT